MPKNPNELDWGQQQHPNSCTRRLQFCAGHRVMKHESKCANLHGHNYVALITAHGPGLDDVGRVIDFGVLKERVGGWIDDHWDHGLVLNQEDKELIEMVGDFKVRKSAGAGVGYQKLYLMLNNPTAENMAAHLLWHVCPDVLHGTGVKVKRVRLWETENCYADATLK